MKVAATATPSSPSAPRPCVSRWPQTVKLANVLKSRPHDSLLNRSKRANPKRSVFASLIPSKKMEMPEMPAIVSHGTSVQEQQMMEMDSMATVIQRATRAKNGRTVAAKQLPDDGGGK